MNIYKLFLEILTPIHIGDGIDIEPYEYVIDEKFYKIDLSRFLLALSPKNQDIFNQLLESDIIKCRGFIKDNFKVEDCVVFSTKISKEIKAFYEKKIDDPRNQMLISTFIRGSSHAPYIPGSSIKGALRTGIIFHFLPQGSHKKGSDSEIKLPRYRKAPYPRDSARDILQEVDRSLIPGLDPQRDPFRAIKITDVTLALDSTIVQRIKTMGKKNNSIQPMEIQLSKEMTYSTFDNNPLSFVAELRYDNQLIKKNRDIKKKLTINDIINSNNAFSRRIIDYELKEYFKNHETSEIYKELKNIWSGLKENEFMFRLGWGSGYNSMTINLKTPNPKYIKTRKLVNGKIPPGWIKGKCIKGT